MRLVPVALVLAALCGTAFAIAGDPEVLLSDRVHGTVGGPGEIHVLTFFAPEGTKIRLNVRRDKGAEDPLATIALEAPGGAAVDVSTGKATLGATGVHTIRVTPTAAGRYRLDVKGKPPKSRKLPFDLLENEETTLGFGALDGAAFTYKLKNAEAVSLDGPAGFTAPVSGANAKGIDLGGRGAYVLGIRGTGGSGKGTLKLKFAKIGRRDLWYTPPHFGFPPTDLGVTPNQGLNTEILTDVTVGGNSVEPGATLALVKGRETVPVPVKAESPGQLVCDLDLIGLKKGTWNLVVTNPNGGSAKTKFKVLSPGSVKLPEGVQPETELWFLDFTEDWSEELDRFGLVGPDEALNREAAGAVRSYVVYLLRSHFERIGRTGRGDDGLPVSFVIEELPAVAGAVGEAYNRLAFTGKEATGALSDNPALPWGFVPVDADNTDYEDIGGDAGTSPIPLDAFDPADAGRTTADFRAVFQSLIADPLASDDRQYFLFNFVPATQAELARWRVVVIAIERLGREIAAVGAHHIGRAMGLGNTTIGLTSEPTEFGLFSGDLDLEFAAAERDRLALNGRPHALPGKSALLKAEVFPLVPSMDYLLPEATTQASYVVSLSPFGGRPDREDGDLSYVFADGVIPFGIEIEQDGRIRGSAPFEDPGSVLGLYHGAFQFVIRVFDDGAEKNAPAASRQMQILHRLNLVINEGIPTNLANPSQIQGRNQFVRDFRFQNE